MSREMTYARAMDRDHVDQIISQWQQERPDVDVSAMAVIGRVSRIERAVRPRLEEVFATHGLESWEFDVLATLRRHGAPYRLTAGQLLDATMITSGAMTHRIDRLQSRGYVERTKHPDDGRLVLVGLTASGLDVVDRALVDHAANEDRLLTALSDRQRTELTKLLRVLLATLEHPDRPASRSGGAPPR